MTIGHTDDLGDDELPSAVGNVPLELEALHQRTDR